VTNSEGKPTGRVGKVEAIGDDHGITVFDAENRALAIFTFHDPMEALHHETALRAILRRATAVVAPRMSWRRATRLRN
jgi:methylglyoxal synthase